MVIVSQDKKTIYNFNNINCIFINSDNEIRVIDNNYIEGYSGDLLGRYKTEERAKEVLQEFTKAFVERRITKDAQKYFGYSSMPEDTYFEMPEK